MGIVRNVRKKVNRKDSELTFTICSSGLKITKAVVDLLELKDEKNYVGWGHDEDENKFYLTKGVAGKSGILGKNNAFTDTELKALLSVLADRAGFEPKGGSAIVFNVSTEAIEVEGDEGEIIKYFELTYSEFLEGKNKEDVGEETPQETPKEELNMKESTREDSEDSEDSEEFEL